MNFGLGGNLSGGKGIVSMHIIDDLLKKGNKKLISLIKLKGFDNYEFMAPTEFVDYVLANLEDYNALKKKFNNSVINADELRNLVSARKSGSNLNEALTQFFMMAGKLDCDIVFTYQLYTSQIDKQFREVTDFNLECVRLGEDRRPLSLYHQRMRIPTINFDPDDLRPENLLPICIRIEFMVYKDEKLLNTGIYKFIDFKGVLEASKHYDTKELIILDRTKYLTRNNSRW